MSVFNLKGAKPLGKGKFLTSGGINDREVQGLLSSYKRVTASGYTSLLEVDIEGALPPGPMQVSPKIDGATWYLISDGKNTALASPSGSLIYGSVPLLDEAKKFSSRCSKITIIAGELYFLKKAGRPRVSDLVSALGGGTKAKTASLGFAAFDLVAGGKTGTDIPPDSYTGRYEALEYILSGGKRVKAVKTETVTTPAEVKTLYKKWVEKGKGEGIIVRTASRRIFKIKPVLTVDAVVIGYTLKNTKQKMVRSLALALMRKDGTYHFIGSCGSLGSDANRKSLLKKIGKTGTESNWRCASSEGTLYRFVKPGIVIEVKSSDVQSENSSGKPIRKMVLSYGKEGWAALQKMPCGSLSNPVFTRIRGDKKADKTGIRIDQITDRCFVAEISQKAVAGLLPESKKLLREVYTKKSKGSIAVRKIVAWKTNKEKTDSRYPAFVVHFTDYSPGRKEPLKREVRLAPSKKEAQIIAKEILVENIKKGWVKS